MKSGYKCVRFCVILFDFCCILSMIFAVCQIMTQRKEMEMLSHFEKESESDLIDGVEAFLDQAEAYDLQIEEMKVACEELERECNVKIYLENIAIELDCKAYLEKFFTIRRDEFQIESDWLRIIYEEGNDYPVGIHIQNQLSDVGMEGAKLGMNFSDVMKSYPEAVEDRASYNGKTIHYLLVEDDAFKYYYIENGASDEITELYISQK